MASSLPTESAGRAGPSALPAELREAYRRDALTVRSLGEATLEEKLLYVGRFLADRGSPGNAGEVFGQLSETVLRSFLADYAANYGPGSQRWMLCSLRAFLRFGYRHGSHGFRDAFTCRMTGQVRFKDLVDLMGHRNPSTTMIYSRSDVSDLRQAALPWPGGGR